MEPQNLPSWALGPFFRPEGDNPVLKASRESTFQCPVLQAPVHWEALHVFNPAAIVKDGRIFLIYRAEDDSGQMKIGGHNSRLGLASSNDGIHFQKHPTPVLYADNDSQRWREFPGGVEDPRIVENPAREYVLTYTQKHSFLSRLAIATSRDLLYWDKRGCAFPRCSRSRFLPYTKAGSIVCAIVDGRLQAVKIQGKYWMYWGVRALHAATSDDLIHWSTGGAIIRPRKGYFDSILNEAGPPALLTEDGIVLIYNGKNHATKGDPTLSTHLYTSGQLLFDKKNPTKCIGRLDRPFFKPELSFEVTGQYKAGATFLEGLVYFQEKWFIYYGCSDSAIAVAIWDPSRPKAISSVVKGTPTILL